MSGREQFNAWVTEYRKGKPYWSTAREEILWDGWQVSRRMALEDAAYVCEQSDADGDGPDSWGWHQKDYARAIRAIEA